MSAHEQVWWSGGGLGRGLGAGWTASDAVPTSWTQYLQRPRGEGKRPVRVRKWVSAFESSISPDGLELIGKVGAAGIGGVEVALPGKRARG